MGIGFQTRGLIEVLRAAALALLQSCQTEEVVIASVLIEVRDRLGELLLGTGKVAGVIAAQAQNVVAFGLERLRHSQPIRTPLHRMILDDVLQSLELLM